MLLAELVATSDAVAATRSRRAKIERLTDCLRRLAPAELEAGVKYLSGELPQGRIGLGYALVHEVRQQQPAASTSLELAEVNATFEQLAEVKGRGVQAERRRLLAQMFVRATPAEQDFLARLIVGELRQGALEAVMSEAIAGAADVSPAEVRRAVMLSGDITRVARAALADGAPALREFSLELFNPVQPMLAQPAEDVAGALETLGSAALEYKLDGARVQIHKVEDKVRVFTRRLNDVTDSVPELVEDIERLQAGQLILDGEAIALREDGRPQPFQVTMRRFGRRLNVEEQRQTLPLSAYYFDCLHVDGDDLIDRPGSERFDRMRAALPEQVIVAHEQTADPLAAQRFLEAALKAGHEGVMAKDPAAGYAAGSRGASWLKIKPAHTLDLVVLAAEWGSGRRKGWLSNLHLGARDPHSSSFVMLGKTFKGLTDAMLKCQTERLLELEVGREKHVVHVRPELVVEIAFNDLQASTQYPGGLALRFARVKSYRRDKSAHEADTIDTVRAIYANQLV